MNPEIEELKRQVAELKSKLSPAGTSSHVDEKHAPLNVEEKEEYQWESYIRTFNKWSKRRITTMFMWVALICIVLLFLHEFLLLIIVILLALVGTSLVTVPPSKTMHKITNKGVVSYDKHFLWEDLVDFWFAQKHDEIVLHINTALRFPTHLYFVVPKEDLASLSTILSNHLKYYQIRDKQNPLVRYTDGRYIHYNDIKDMSQNSTIRS